MKNNVEKTMFEIENNIPIPLKKLGMYEFLDKLEVGQSFVVPLKTTYLNELNKWRNQFRQRNMKMVSRKIDSNQIRIWRSE